jgi:glutamate formiminotransferase/formiminotetrahydrofolate cyclodeaminase
MAVPLVECVPNFSEGRRADVIEAIRAAIASVHDVRVLDCSADPWHNRAVITFVAPPDAAVEGAFAGIRVARDRIDLTRHAGVHPRMGAADVVPFVPLEGSTMEDCAALARALGDRVGRELHIPVFLYEHAASRPSRRNLADVRRGGFERLRAEIESSPEYAPDFGPHRMHPTAGAVAIGARPFLVAFNVYLGGADALSPVRALARAVRDSSGGLPGVKALALEVNGEAQLSMNLVDLERTGLWTAFEAVEREAAQRGLTVHRTEIVGLVPERALWHAGGGALRLTNFSPDRVLEHRLRATAPAPPLETLLDRIAAPSTAPGGGSVAAYAGALAAALTAMVGGVAARRGLGGDAAADDALAAYTAQARELLRLAQQDADAYGGYVAAKRAGGDAETALADAARVPLRIARSTASIAAGAADVTRDGLPAAAADAATASILAHAACAAAALTVRVNAAAMRDRPLAEALIADADGTERAARAAAERAALAAEPRT